MVLSALLVFALDDIGSAKQYRTWTCVTPKAIDMAMPIAISCVGPASWDASANNPHVLKRFKVWVNPAGKGSMAKSKDLFSYPRSAKIKPFPAGSVIVKEKFDASTMDATKPLPATPELLTIMVKGKPGSNPSTGDWSYYVADAKFKKLDRTQEARCASCHAAKKATDFTFQGYGRLVH